VVIKADAGSPKVAAAGPEIDHSKGNGQMNKSRRSPHTFVLAITMLVAFPSPSPAQVRVLISGGFSAPYQELLSQFEKSTGVTVTTARGASEGGGPNGPITISAELQSGQPADVVILSREGLAELSAEGRIVTGSDAGLASVPLGVGVRAGTPHPDVSTVTAFKQTLLRAKSIGIQSTSGMYLKTKVFPQLGIADALACNRHPKLKTCNLGCRPRHRFVSAILGNSFATVLVVAQI
jgi:molybdate transport system substrate-binding protein